MSLRISSVEITSFSLVSRFVCLLASSTAMHTGHSLNTHAAQSCGNSPVEARHRAVQKSMRSIPKRLLPAWGVRWPTLRTSDGTSRNSSGAEFQFQLDIHPTSTLDENDSSAAPVVHSHRGRHMASSSRPKRSKRQRDERQALHAVISEPKHQSSSSVAGCKKRARVDALSYYNDPLLSSQLETSTSTPQLYEIEAALNDASSLMPALLPYESPQSYQNQLPFTYPTAYTFDAPAAGLEQNDPQSLLLDPHGAADTTLTQLQNLHPTESTLRWALGPETSFWAGSPVTPPHHHHPGSNRNYIDAMDPGYNPIHFPASDPPTF